MVYIEDGFLSTPHLHESMEKMEVPDVFSDPLDTLPIYESLPIVLQNKVCDVHARCVEVDVDVMGGICPLHHLLAELCLLNPANYHIQLVAWLWRHLLHLKFASAWVHTCGLEIKDYYEHLQLDGPADGLEVLLVSLAINVLINIVLEDVV